MSISPRAQSSDEELFFHFEEESETSKDPELPSQEVSPLQGRVTKSLPEIYPSDSELPQLSQSLPTNPILAMMAKPSVELGCSPPGRRDRTRSLMKKHPEYHCSSNGK